MRSLLRAFLLLKDQSDISAKLPAVLRLQQALAREIKFYQVLRLLFTDWLTQPLVARSEIVQISSSAWLSDAGPRASYCRCVNDFSLRSAA
jgi:hypothetical protein